MCEVFLAQGWAGRAMGTCPDCGEFLMLGGFYTQENQ